MAELSAKSQSHPDNESSETSERKDLNDGIELRGLDFCIFLASVLIVTLSLVWEPNNLVFILIAVSLVPSRTVWLGCLTACSLCLAMYAFLLNVTFNVAESWPWLLLGIACMVLAAYFPYLHMRLRVISELEKRLENQSPHAEVESDENQKSGKKSEINEPEKTDCE